MSLNTSQEDIIELRREAVARLRLQGLTEREIVAMLPKLSPPVINPETNEPFALGTIHNDLQALKGQWTRAAKNHTDQHKGRILAQLQEVFRMAVSETDLQAALRALKQECDIRGIDAPSRQEITGKDGEPLFQDLAAALISVCGVDGEQSIPDGGGAKGPSE